MQNEGNGKYEAFQRMLFLTFVNQGYHENRLLKSLT